jgi:histidinol-phosphate aminotransferase
MLEARLAIQNLKEYRPPLSGRQGLRLDFNENTQGPSPAVLRRLRELRAEELARYPEREPIERFTATSLGVSPQEILLTNGIDEAIHLICQTFLEAADEALLVVPTFAMYALLAAGTGARVIALPALSDFEFPTQSLLKRIGPATRLIFIANPNNPTGTVATRAEILQITHAAPHAAVLVDEAYFEFYGQTLIDQVPKLSNLFVARTFSKVYGMASFRVGALIGPERQMRVIRKAASPYNVNGLALACIPAALADRNFVEQYVAEVRLGRERLQAKLCSLGVRYWPSHANFVLAHFGSSLHLVVAGLAERGILVRDRSSDSGCQGCVRITIGMADETDRVIDALEEIVAMLSVGRRSLA